MENLRAEKSVLFFLFLLLRKNCCTCTENFNFEKLNFFGMENLSGNVFENGKLLCCCRRGRTKKRNF